MKMNEEKNIPIEDENLEEQAEELKPEEEAEVQEEAAAQEEPAEEAAEPEEKAAEPEKGTEEDPRDKKIEELNAKYMRLMADFQNQKKRFDKEKADIHQYANEKIVKNLLEVLDNFERALDATKDADPNLHEGMELIFKQLMAALEKAGVAEIKALGEEFDPNFHNAVMMEETDEYESNKVSEVMQKGYTLNSRVIRPSMVKVAQ
ncbi:MAG: nucleotide exchange factor GrpE [Firmicutes bacterium]|nr:nucleotide exchange factor GrpE [Clostridiales bacterium]MBR3183652.1 nucleotide exchange factor GrpE [Bacillota bacterium]MBR3261474.1 nucleotide exchange factor GrpE [Bacillota bacterium]MBR3374798.1 nucleotide exchange factor GrpE [Bacillota bacterium]MBR4025104.1 nucleotide exchange factor GrpE [Bacillota bacterium]